MPTIQFYTDRELSFTTAVDEKGASKRRISSKEGRDHTVSAAELAYIKSAANPMSPAFAKNVELGRIKVL